MSEHFSSILYVIFMHMFIVTETRVRQQKTYIIIFLFLKNEHKLKINAYSNKKAANIFNFFMAEGSFQILAIFYEKFLKMKYFHKSNCFEHIRHIFWIRKKLYEMDTKLLFFVFGTVKLYYIIMQKSVYLKNVLITLQAYYKVGLGVFFSETRQNLLHRVRAYYYTSLDLVPTALVKISF